MQLRRIVTLVALPAMFAFERMAYYGMRAALMMYLIRPPTEGLGMQRAEASTVRSAFTFAVAVAPLLGGLLGFAIGPRLPLLAGLLLALVGYLVLGAGSSSSAIAALILISVGTGLLKPNVFAIAAQEFGRGLDSLRASVCFAIFCAINGGAFAGGFGGAMASPDGPMSVAAAFRSSGVTLFIALLIGAALVAVLRSSDKALAAVSKPDLPATSATADLDAALQQGPGALQATTTTSGKGTGAASIVLLLATPLFLGVAAFGNVQFDAIEHLGSSFGQLAWLMGIDPVVAMATTGLGAVGMLVAALTIRRPLPLLYVVALGLVLFALGSALLLLGGEQVGLGSIITGIVLTALGDNLAAPLGISLVLRGSSPRAAPLWAAVWLVVSALLGSLAAFAMEGSRTLLAAATAACLLASIAIAALARPLHRRLFPERA